MTEIPEHLLKRAQAAREKAAGGDAAGGDAGSDRIPDQLLDRTKAAGSGVAVADRPTAVVAAAAAGGLPVGAGPGGHTQRLLTVVKSGSIQEVKAAPIDKVHTWPHLLAVEFVAALACTA
ncbi:MAG: menaquinol-cytochrome c reductase cytochrome b subunit, partial [Actinomycetota bacterium]